MSNVSPHIDTVGQSGGHCCPTRLILGSWNLEGLTDIKVHEVIIYMRANSIDVMCIETRKTSSDFVYAVFLSGSGGIAKEWAGVGFIVAPHVLGQIVSFKPFSNRIAGIRVKVVGGSVSILSVYAPHNMKDLAERFSFYETLDICYDKISVNGAKLIVGDFNARLGMQRPGEEAVLGPYSFGREARHAVEVPNRDLLLEFCISRGLIVGNTFLPSPDHNKATYHEPSVAPMSPITSEGFAMLDLCLVPAGLEVKLLSVSSDRTGTIASHHFPITAVMDAKVPRPGRTHKDKVKKNWAALKNPDVKDCFVKEYVSAMPSHTTESVDERWQNICEAMAKASASYVPPCPKSGNKPWISQATLTLIGHKQKARLECNWTLEKSLRKEVKRSVKRDRATFLNELAGTGDWKALRKLRAKRRPQQTRLLDQFGNTVGTEEQSSTFADHLEKYSGKFERSL